MGRDLGDWNFDPVLVDLLTIARLEHGVSDGRVAMCAGLAEHPAVRARSSGATDPRRAIATAIADAERIDPAILSENDRIELRLLLGVPGSVEVDGRTFDPCSMDSTDRGERAATVGFRTVQAYRKIRRQGDGSGWSPEVAVLSRAKLALDLLDAPESATRAHGWTVRNGTTPPESDASDLLGTWRGWVRSDWMLRSSETERPKQLPSYLVFEANGEGHLALRNFVAEAVSYMVVQRVFRLGDRRRVIAVYEVETQFSPDAMRPSHRGAMVLDIDGLPARRINGPYWTDRGTRGQLTFDTRDSRVANDFDTAAAMFE